MARLPSHSKFVLKFYLTQLLIPELKNMKTLRFARFTLFAIIVGRCCITPAAEVVVKSPDDKAVFVCCNPLHNEFIPLHVDLMALHDEFDRQHASLNRFFQFAQAACRV